MQMETFNMACHCTTRRISGNFTLEMLSSDPQNPRYFWSPPVPYPLLHRRLDDADLGSPESHPQVDQSSSTPEPSGLGRMRISAIIEQPGSDQPPAGAHSLGSEPRISRRAARRYRIGVSEWNLQAQRRWGMP